MEGNSFMKISIYQHHNQTACAACIQVPLKHPSSQQFVRNTELRERPFTLGETATTSSTSKDRGRENQHALGLPSEEATGKECHSTLFCISADFTKSLNCIVLHYLVHFCSLLSLHVLHLLRPYIVNCVDLFRVYVQFMFKTIVLTMRLNICVIISVPQADQEDSFFLLPRELRGSLCVR